MTLVADVDAMRAIVRFVATTRCNERVGFGAQFRCFYCGGELNGGWTPDCIDHKPGCVHEAARALMKELA